jgi:hypothetical protein
MVRPLLLLKVQSALRRDLDISGPTVTTIGTAAIIIGIVATGADGRARVPSGFDRIGNVTATTIDSVRATGEIGARIPV